MIRLDKLLANRTTWSRSEVKNLLGQGAVQVDGIPGRSIRMRSRSPARESPCRAVRICITS